MRDWIGRLRPFASIDALFMALDLAVKRIGELIALLGLKVTPLPGKKRIKKSRLENDRRQILKTVDSMLGHVAEIVVNSRRADNDLALELEKYVLKSFETECVDQIEEAFGAFESDRGEKTYVFPWAEPDSYGDLVADPEKFKSETKRFLQENKHATGHKPGCSDHSRYNVCGFRSRPRKTDTPTGRKEYPIRMVECRDCGQRFSMVPSFLPREKHFSLEIIGSVCESMLRFGPSIQAAMQGLQLIAKPVRSKQTILNWLRWLGSLHPAAVSTRAGVVGSGYLQEDEGFEKEPNLRTYSAVLVDPKNLLVWHCDYLDGVDEDSLAFASQVKHVLRCFSRVIDMFESGKEQSRLSNGVFISPCFSPQSNPVFHRMRTLAPSLPIFPRVCRPWRESLLRWPPRRPFSCLRERF